MNWLRVIRKSKGLTQNQVALKANLSLSFYCQIEKGKRKPSVETAKMIAKELQFDWTLFYEQVEGS